MAAQNQDERAIRRLIKRAIGRRDFSMLVMLFHELGLVFLEQEDSETEERLSGDVAWDYMTAENSLLPA